MQQRPTQRRQPRGARPRPPARARLRGVWTWVGLAVCSVPVIALATGAWGGGPAPASSRTTDDSHSRVSVLKLGGGNDSTTNPTAATVGDATGDAPAAVDASAGSDLDAMQVATDDHGPAGAAATTGSNAATAARHAGKHAQDSAKKPTSGTAGSGTGSSANTDTAADAGGTGDSGSSGGLSGGAATESSSGATTAEATAPRPLAGKVIVIDPGHNGGNATHARDINKQVWIGTGHKACDTTGTATNSGYSEATFTLDMSKRVAKILRRQGATVTLTRTNNRGWGPCIDRRAEIGNDAKADIAISIHGDGAAASGHGFHVIRPTRIRNLTTDIYTPSKRFAQQLRDALVAGGLTTSTYLGHRGIDVRGDLGGLNLSDVPKVFLEVGNMRNDGDARNMRNRHWRQRTARTIAKALGDWALAN